MRFADGLGGRPLPRPSLVAYLMADRRRRGAYRRLATEARKVGADAIEIGFPFSDPIADGPVLQKVADHALRHGTTWADLLGAVREVSRVLPTAVMTYANPVWRRGLDRSLGELHRAGAGGLLVPDLPLEEIGPWKQSAERADVDLILLAAPGASVTRVRRIAAASSGFLYLVSRYGTTGVSGGMAGDLKEIARAAHREAPRLPVIIGFGIHDAASARRAMAGGADGVVVATALEERLGGSTASRPIIGVLAPIRRALGNRSG